MKLLTSKKAIVVIIGVILMILRQHLKEMQGTPVAELLAPILAYLVGQSVTDLGKSTAQIESGIESDSPLDTLKELFSQRKFQAMIFTVVIAFVHEYGKGFIDDQTLQAIIGLTSTYIVGQGVVDKGKAATLLETKAADPGDPHA